MASSYPGGLDSFTNPAGSDPLNTAGAKLHSAQHSNANDAIEAIQSTLGLDPQGAEADVAARLDAIEAGGGGGGGLVLIDSGTFSTAAEFLVDQFDGTFDDYALHCSLVGGADNVLLRSVLRDGGSDVTTSDYDSVHAINHPGGFAIETSGTNAAYWNVGRMGTAGRGHFRFDILGPNLAEFTGFLNQSASRVTPTYAQDICSGLYKATTQCEGIKIYPASSTFTGRWALYGYAK